MRAIRAARRAKMRWRKISTSRKMTEASAKSTLCRLGQVFVWIPSWQVLPEVHAGRTVAEWQLTKCFQIVGCTANFGDSGEVATVEIIKSDTLGRWNWCCVLGIQDAKSPRPPSPLRSDHDAARKPSTSIRIPEVHICIRR